MVAYTFGSTPFTCISTVVRACETHVIIHYITLHYSVSERRSAGLRVFIGEPTRAVLDGCTPQDHSKVKSAHHIKDQLIPSRTAWKKPSRWSWIATTECVHGGRAEAGHPTQSLQRVSDRRYLQTQRSPHRVQNGRPGGGPSLPPATSGPHDGVPRQHPRAPHAGQGI